MGLEGYLEDLGISDILQIVSLSKKSGTLHLQADEEFGTITFVDGQVVRATAAQYPETLGQLLINQQLVSQQQVTDALARQQAEETHRPLGAILVDSCPLDPTHIESVVQRQIEKIVASFFAWCKGTFTFQLGDPESFGSAALNPFDLMLDKGLSSHHLVVKGERLVGQPDGEQAVDDGILQTEINQLEARIDKENLKLLRGMLAELENPYIAGGIIMLILRYASEIMNRAIVFDVRGRQLVGLGQFGLTGLSSSADEIVRKLRIEIDSESLFAQVLKEKSSIYSELNDSLSERTLIELLDGVPERVFLSPLVSDGKVIALFYGDNYPDQRPIQAASAFEVFLSHAGLAMEQTL